MPNNSSDKKAPVPLSRTKSTPVASAQHQHRRHASGVISSSGMGGGDTTHATSAATAAGSSSSNTTTNSNSNASSLSYALRRVFSSDTRTQFPKNEEEAQDLIPHNHGSNANSSLALSQRVSSHVLERPHHDTIGSGVASEDEGAELILDEDIELMQDNAMVATAMLEEQKQLRKGGGYQLRKFLSTPHGNSNNTAAAMRMGNKGGGVGGGSGLHSSVLRREKSYDPRDVSFDEDDAFHDNYASSTRRTQVHHHDNEDDESPLFRSDVEVSLADHTTNKRSRTQSNEVVLHSLDPIPFQRNPLSFRRKTSDLLKSSSPRKEDHHHQDDLSTVAESIEMSSTFDHDLKKGGLGSYKFMKYHFSLRRSIILSAIVLIVCCIGGVVLSVVEKSSATDEKLASNLQVVSVQCSSGGSSGGGSNGGSSTGGNGNGGSVGGAANFSNDNSMEYLFSDGGQNSQGNNNSNNNNNAGQNASVQNNGETSSSGGSSTNTSNNVAATSSSSASSGSSNVSATLPTVNPNAVLFPSYAPTSATYTKFYVMADCPYDDNERENLMPAYIEGLSSDAAFLFHLGDLQYAAEDNCEEWAYESASSIIKKSPIPTFVVPGDNDMNDCPDHEHGEDMWKQYFHKIDEYWEHDFNLTRWGKFDESFSFVNKGVLYFGLNVVGGDPYSQSEAEIRYALHLANIKTIINGLDAEEFKVIVILAHADPTYYTGHEEFFEGLAEIIEKVGKPTIHFNGDYHEYYETEGGEYDVDNYMRITLDGESISPPISVEIDVSKMNPITVSRRRDDLYVDCCSDGWPWSEEEL